MRILRNLQWPICDIAYRNIARFSLCHFVLPMRHCDVRRRISAVGDSLDFPFASAFNTRDVMGSRVAPFQCVYALLESAPFSIATRYSSQGVNTKYFFQTKIFFGFLVKGPPLLDVITNIKRRGGLLVTTTMAIHCEEPVISAFLLTVHFRNSKNFICLNFVMDRQSRFPLTLSTIFCLNPFYISVSCFLRFFFWHLHQTLLCLDKR